MITEGKTQEALKFLRWRKQILKISELNGWEIANAIAKITNHKLQVHPQDIIQVILNFLFILKANIGMIYHMYSSQNLDYQQELFQPYLP
jgi:hypothetical protein